MKLKIQHTTETTPPYEMRGLYRGGEENLRLGLILVGLINLHAAETTNSRWKSYMFFKIHAKRKGDRKIIKCDRVISDVGYEGRFAPTSSYSQSVMKREPMLSLRVDLLLNSDYVDI